MVEEIIGAIAETVTEEATKKIPRKYFIIALVIIVAIILWFFFKS